MVRQYNSALAPEQSSKPTIQPYAVDPTGMKQPLLVRWYSGAIHHSTPRNWPW